jgi:hypothetical protein
MKNKELPSTDTLALLAAIIAPHKLENRHDIVNDAFMLWMTAKQKLEEEAKENEDVKLHDEVMTAIYDAIPKPKRFPVGFDEFLLSLMPEVDKQAQRVKRFRDFLGETTLEGEDNKPVGSLKAGDVIQVMRNQKFNMASYLEIGEKYTHWWKATLSEKRSKAGAKKNK